ncbi:hypothetical protein I9T54_00660, partial [Campylobacter peloridis]|nr:hypothetical protein [Campylobacter peloridis]
MKYLQKNILSTNQTIATKILTCKNPEQPIKNEYFLKNIEKNYANYPVLF